MKFEITKNELLNKLNFASRVATSKSLISALSGILIEADDVLNIYSTDLETSIKSSLKAKIIEKGRAVVPAKIFINILRNFPESKVSVALDINTNQLKVMCEKSVFNLNTFAIDEYPEFPTTTEKTKFKIDFDIFKKLLNKVIKSASGEESRAILTGILIEVDNSSLDEEDKSSSSYIKIVGTDSYRLAFIEEKIDYSGDPIKVVVPNKVLDNIVKSDYTGKTTEINIEENQISFLLANEDGTETMIISRLLSGKFPEYKQLIPKEFKHNIILDKDKVNEVVKRTSSISQDNIPIKIEIGDGKMYVSMNIKEVGNSSEEVDIAYAEGKIEIAFNPYFLLEGINMLDEEKFIFSVEESLKPVLIRNVKAKNLIYLLMPIRIS
ncbi:MAG TPA: DNA polymerase III subunit beta [Actinobacteria bacterium]|jgi:DNA polymerase-3 subunit beta|nr:DNA polymerase III subunit beta [Actinomycetota bacterium]